MDLTYFNDVPFYRAVCRFFADLNIPINALTEAPAAPQDVLTNTYNPNNPAHQLMREVYVLGGVDDAIFQNQTSALDTQQIRARGYEGLLIFGVILQSGGHLPTRTQMAEITRAFNREFHYTPVIVVFLYDRYLSFASCERLAYKQTWREGEKVGKVSILKDVDPAQPHTGHLKILETLKIERAGARAITSFAALYAYWQEVFSVSLLNKRFYRELSNWYFWALQQVEFPEDAEPDRDIRNATSVIRLITRLIFVWFLKEKRLIPDALFDKIRLDGYLKYDDATGSTYYKAILQNLFFATLNTEMQKDNPHSRKFVHRQYGVQGFYRYRRFFHDPEQALELFKNIPFLNGGLFENLDKQVGTPDEVRIDCFSDRPALEARLKVPDVLFFGEDAEVDLSAVYGDAKRSHESVRGVITILNAYKFTIAENTPLEEEIALDPELLGNVFENLLASYNPETRTTARKQTGSFYTPREIVNYMVDESILAYLANALHASGDGNHEPIEPRLRHLIAEHDAPHQFSPAEAQTLIQAIDRAKILDPACGSGAFPMGILHKMVRLLSKLDPQNAEWKERQIAKVQQMMADAERIDDTRIREQVLGDLEKNVAGIEDAFQNNELDYGRKLYLIENCIYGVDIQPVAVQIAKLRFFISLIVDQRVNPDRPNLGIRPLPNLETKFVAANTLIGIGKPQQMLLRNPEIDNKEHELKQVRQRHFEARTPKTKDKYRQEDERLRNELAGLLKKDGFPADTTAQLARWNPYDQNASAGFFDPEWMFGLQDGFDIALGNPPYIQSRSITNAYKTYFYKNYQTAEYQLNTFGMFIEKSINLLKEQGVYTFIIPNYWLSTKYDEKLRQFVFLKNQTHEVLNLFKLFESASVDTLVIVGWRTSSRQFPKTLLVKSVASQSKGIEDRLTAIAARDWAIQRELTFLNERSDTKINFEEKFALHGEYCLSDFVELKQGMKPYEKGKGNPSQTNEMMEKKVYHATSKIDETYLPLLGARNVKRYLLFWENEWIKYGPNLAAPRSKEIFEGERILIRRIISGDHIEGTFLSETYINNTDLINILPKQGGRTMPLKVLMAILLSRLCAFVLKKENINLNRETFPKINVETLKTFPIPEIPKSQQELLIVKVDYMLELYQQFHTEAQNFLRFLEVNYHPKKVSNKLKAFDAFTDKEFITELARQKVVLSKQDELMVLGVFEQKKASRLSIESSLQEVDQELEQIIYKLYNLTYAEVNIVDPDVALSAEEYQ